MNKDFKYKNTVGIESTYPKDMPEDHSNIPVWNSENRFYEDRTEKRPNTESQGGQEFLNRSFGQKSDL